MIQKFQECTINATSQELLFNKDDVDQWSNQPNKKHVISEELRARIKAMITSYYGLPSTMIKQIKHRSADNEWIGITFDNKSERLTHDWVEKNFRYPFAQWYNVNIGDINKPNISEWLTLPIGQSNMTKLDETGGWTFKYMQEEEDDNCAIINVLNVISKLGDEDTCDVVKPYCYKNTLITTVSQQRDLNRCNRHYDTLKFVQQLLRQNGYMIKKQKIDDIFNWKTEEPTLIKLHSLHCVVVWKDEIYDANHFCTLKLNKKNLDWCCGEYERFNGVLGAFTFYPNPKKIKKIQNTFISNL